MVNAAKSAGLCLFDVFHFNQNKVVFKGQCSGALPMSQAVTENFKRSHLWVDQSPAYYANVVKNGLYHAIDEKKNSKQNRLTKKIIVFSAQACASAAYAVASCLLPSCDVIDAFKKVQGAKIYTIGVPKNGFGGDELVPKSDVQAIKKVLNQSQQGYFLPIDGGRHVTDWWKGTGVEKQIGQIFDTHGMRMDPFAEECKDNG